MSTLIVTGGTICAPQAKKYLAGKSFDRVIAVDGAAKVIREIGVIPDILVGDFDTLSADVLKEYELENKVSIRKFNPEKDDTDTGIALQMAFDFENGCEGASVLILGAIGTRMDHTLANLFWMQRFCKAGIEATIVDEHNRISMVDSVRTIRFDEQYGKYVSFVSLAPKTTGITLEGFKYPLLDAELLQESSLCVSNEIAKEVAKVSIKDGLLMMIESRD